MSLREWLGFKPRIGDLARRLLAAWARDGVDGWRYDAAKGELLHAGGAVLNLTNIHLEYAQAARSNRGWLLDKYKSLGTVEKSEIPALWSVAQCNIYAVLRSRFDAPMMALHAQSRGVELPPTLLSPSLVPATDLCIKLVYDFGPNVAHVRPDNLATWGQSADQVLAIAIGNLRALTAPRWTEEKPGVFQLHSEVSYEESFVLLDKARSLLGFAEHAVFLPCNRGVLLAADARSETAVLALLDEADASLRKRPWPMSATPLQAHGGELVGWTPSNPAVRKRLQEMQRMQVAGVYDNQRALLEQIHGEDVFVANVGLLNHTESNAIRTWCTWSEGVPTLLPETDLVMFCRDAGTDSVSGLCVAWEVVARICARHLLHTPLDPVRHRVDSFPDAGEWVELQRVGHALGG